MRKEKNPEGYKLFVVGGTYKTKFQTSEEFTIHKIDLSVNGEVLKFWGVYQNSPHLTNCPIDPERLILN